MRAAFLAMLVLLLDANSLFSQSDSWEFISESTLHEKDMSKRQIIPHKYKTFTLDGQKMNMVLIIYTDPKSRHEAYFTVAFI